MLKYRKNLIFKYNITKKINDKKRKKINYKY